MNDYVVKEDVSLKDLNTYKIGGKASYFVKPKSINALIKLIDDLKKKNIPYYILGKGSNVILPDEDYQGVIINLSLLKTFEVTDNLIYAESGLSLNEFITFLIDKSFPSYYELYGIPGSLGGAVVCNAGAGNTDIYKYLKAVIILEDGIIKTISKENINYSYRHTEFKESNKIIIGAIFQMEKGNVDGLWDKIKESLKVRSEKQPLNFPNAGSVFQNPKGTSAGKLIDECGLKGLKENGAMISLKHANFIVNWKDAQSSDIINLVEKIKKEVKKQKNIDLNLEQIIVKW